MFNNITNAISFGLLGPKKICDNTPKEEPVAEVKRPEVVVHTAKEAKASRNLVRLHGLGVITLAPDVLDRHENVVVADELRKSDNLQRNQMQRYFASPKNRLVETTGAFGNDMAMNDVRRSCQFQRVDGETVSTGVARPWDEDEYRTPRQIEADNAREAKAAA